jgi:hypothetical protein
MAAHAVVVAWLDARVGGRNNRNTNRDNSVVDSSILREDQALIIRLLGRTRGTWFLQTLGKSEVRLAMAICRSVPLVVLVCGILPGVLAIEYTVLLRLLPSLQLWDGAESVAEAEGDEASPHAPAVPA